MNLAWEGNGVTSAKFSVTTNTWNDIVPIKNKLLRLIT